MVMCLKHFVNQVMLDVKVNSMYNYKQTKKIDILKKHLKHYHSNQPLAINAFLE